MTWLRYLLLALGAFTSTFALSKDKDGTTWAAANEAYQKGKYEEAKVDYLQIVHAGHYSADLFYNLGNVWFQIGRSREGHSQLRTWHSSSTRNWRKPDPIYTPSAKIVGNDDQPTLRDHNRRIRGLFSTDRIPRLLDLCIFFARGQTKAGAHDRFLVSTLPRQGFIFLCSAAMWVWIGTGSKDANRALIIESASDLKYGPAVTARSVESLQIGEQVRLISDRGDWTFCRADSGNLGWILTRKTERVIP